MKSSIGNKHFKLLSLSFELLLNNWMWKQFGYNKRPKRGMILNFFLKKINKIKIEKEEFLSREFIIIGIVIITKEITKNRIEQHELIGKILAQFIYRKEFIKSLDFNSSKEMKNYFVKGTVKYSKSNLKDYNDIFITRAYDYFADICESQQEVKKTVSNSNWEKGAEQIFNNVSSPIMSLKEKCKNSTNQNLHKKYLSINELLLLIIKSFRTINSASDFIEMFSKYYLKDISNFDIVKQMNASEPNIEGHTNKFYEFKEAQDTYGIIDIDFIYKKLMNVRIQLFFNKTRNNERKQIDIDDYMRNVKNIIEKLSEVNLNKKLYPGYNYSGRSKEELIIGIRKVSGRESISIIICEDIAMEDIAFIDN